MKAVSKYIEIDPERCKGCSLCLAVCHLKNIRPSNNFNSKGWQFVEVIDPNNCSGCGMCVGICPDTAIRIYSEKQHEPEKTC